MKKTNLFKRAIAVLISVLMVVSSLPFTAITASAATKQWITFASTDFTKSTSTAISSNASGSPNRQGSTLVPVNPGDATVPYQFTYWSSTGSYAENSNGLFIPDGDLLITDTTTHTTPITGLDNFRMDLEFEFTGDWTGTASAAMKMTTSEAEASIDYSGVKASNTNNYLSIADEEDRVYYGTGSGSYYSNNGLLMRSNVVGKNQTAHIIVEVLDGNATVTIKSANGTNKSITHPLTNTMNSNDIKGIFFGAVGHLGAYMKNVRYHNIVFSKYDVPSIDLTYQTYGNITIDPIVYIHGAYDNSTSHEYAYMNNGDTIADGTVTGERQTKVTVRNGKTLHSVEVVDTSDYNVCVEDGRLKGSLGGGYKYVTLTDNLSSTVTLRFVFDDGSYELHRLPVKTNPVAKHTIGMIYASNWSMFNYHRRALAFEVLSKDSIGAVNESVKAGGDSSKSGLFSISGSTIKATKSYSIVNPSMYAPYNTNKHTVTEGSNVTISCGNITQDVINVNKLSGFYGYITGDANDNHSFIIKTANPALYYLDLSSSNNYGVKHTDGSTGTYSVESFVGNLALSSDFQAGSPNNGGSSLVSSSSSNGSTISIDTTSQPVNLADNSNTNGTFLLKGIAKAGDIINATVSTTYSASNGKTVTTTIETDYRIIVTDKSKIRNLYDGYITNLTNGTIKKDCYTEESFNAFNEALLVAEEFINDSHDTTSVDTAYNNLLDAYNALSHTSSSSTRNANFVNVDSNTLLATTCDTTEECKYDVQTYCTVCDKTISSRTVNVDRLQHSYTGTSVYKPVDGDVNGYTEYRCVNGCNELGGRVYDKNTDWNAYDAAVTVSNAYKADTKRYTTDSMSKYIAEVAKFTDGVTSGDKTKSQAFIDRMTGGIESAASILQIASYKVTFKVQYNGEIIEDETEEYTVPYGTVQPFAYTPSSDKYIVKWTAEDEKDDKRRESTIATTSNTASHAIYSDTTIIVYISDSVTEDEDTYSVTLIDKNENVIGLVTVPAESGYVLTKNGNSLSVVKDEDVTATLAAPKYPFYQVTDFVNAQTSVSVVDVTITEDITIKARYSAISQINIKSDQAVTINKKYSAPYTAFFDEKIVAYAKDAKAWYADGELVCYGDTYTFQASTSVTLSYSTDSVSTTLSLSRIDFAHYDADSKAFRIVVSNCVPEGATIVEQGVKILTSSSTTAEVTSDKVINGTKKYVATKTTGTGKQFMYTIAVNNNINTMAIVSFVTYTVDGGEPITVWSSEGETKATMVRR